MKQILHIATAPMNEEGRLCIKEQSQLPDNVVQLLELTELNAKEALQALFQAETIITWPGAALSE